MDTTVMVVYRGMEIVNIPTSWGYAITGGGGLLRGEQGFYHFHLRNIGTQGPPSDIKDLLHMWC